MTNERVSLKLLIDTRSQKVLFAEAEKEFVDFLFYLLALPMGTVIRLLTNKSMVGSIGNLYDSIENLSQSYIQTNQKKDYLLKPQAPAFVQIPTLFLTNEYVANKTSFLCPNCRQNGYSYPLAPNTSSFQVGFVKDVVTYMVMDDLVVNPMSTISIITLLNEFNVKEVGILKEKVVNFTITEGLKLLKASLQSKSVLTTVFLGPEAAESTTAVQVCLNRRLP